MNRVISCTAFFLLAATAVAGQGPGENRGEGKRGSREWGGMEMHMCGADLHVVAVEGSKQVFHPPAKFFEKFKPVLVDQGELPRYAVTLDALFTDSDATSVMFTDCDDGQQEISKAEAADYSMIMSGKGVIKLARAGSNGKVATLQRMVREIRFSKQVK